MAAHAAGDDAPNDQLVALEHVPRWVLWVLRQENHLLTAYTKAFAYGFVVQQRHDDVTVGKFHRTIYDGPAPSKDKIEFCTRSPPFSN